VNHGQDAHATAGIRESTSISLLHSFGITGRFAFLITLVFTLFQDITLFSPPGAGAAPETLDLPGFLEVAKNSPDHVAAYGWT
jgi:hypothetical protein